MFQQQVSLSFTNIEWLDPLDVDKIAYSVCRKSCTYILRRVVACKIVENEFNLKKARID